MCTTAASWTQPGVLVGLFGDDLPDVPLCDPANRRTRRLADRRFLQVVTNASPKSSTFLAFRFGTAGTGIARREALSLGQEKTVDHPGSPLSAAKRWHSARRRHTQRDEVALDPAQGGGSRTRAALYDGVFNRVPGRHVGQYHRLVARPRFIHGSAVG